PGAGRRRGALGRRRRRAADPGLPRGHARRGALDADGPRVTDGRPGPTAERGSGLLGDGADVELDLDLVAHQEAAGLQRGVPGQAEVLAVDLELGLEARPVVAERVLRGAGELGLQLHALGDAVDRQVARDDVVVAVRAHTRGGEGPGRLLAGVPAVRA